MSALNVEPQQLLYLLHLWRGRVDFPELKRKVADFAREYKPRVMIVEDKASGQSLIQELKHGSTLAILPVRLDTDKRTRAAAVTPLIEAGRSSCRRAQPGGTCFSTSSQLFRQPSTTTSRTARSRR